MEEQHESGFLEHLRVDRGLEASTVAAYRRNIYEFIEYLAALAIVSLGWVQRDTVALYYRIIAQKRGFCRSTVRDKCHAVHALYAWLKSQGYVLLNPCPQPPSYTERRLPRRLPRRGSIVKLLRKLYEAGGILGPRDYSVVDLAYSCGLRRTELARLNVDDVCIEEGTIRARGKGGHERLVPVGKETLKDLQYYIYQVRPRFFRGATSRALFVTATKGGARINRAGINRIFWRSRMRYGTRSPPICCAGEPRFRMSQPCWATPASRLRGSTRECWQATSKHSTAATIPAVDANRKLSTWRHPTPHRTVLSFAARCSAMRRNASARRCRCQPILPPVKNRL